KECPVSGQVILLDGKYRLKHVLGEGSFGVVWAARNIDTQKEVAIKSLRAEVASDPAVLARFFWEATAAGRIHNPHVCDVLDLVKSGAHGPYIVLERLSGRSLEALIHEQGRLSPETAVGLLRQALVGLEAVHRAGIVHRDMKPENIFLHETVDGRVVVKLLDFGISKFSVRSSTTSRTAADMFMGTPEYTSPEQARGAAEVDARSDIWAVGAILYKALSGVPPFQGPDIPSILTAILHFPHRPLTEVAPHVPAALSAVVDRCLCKDREQRWASCAELSAALEPFESAASSRTLIGGLAESSMREPVRAVTGGWPKLAEEADVEFSLIGEVRPHAGVQPPPSRPPVTPPSASPRTADPVILSASAGDRRWLELLRQQLRSHRSGSQLVTWETGEIEPGTVRREAMAAAFSRARAVVLLVSPQFLAEEFVPGGELYSLVLMAHERELPVMLILISACDWAATDLAEFKVLGDPERPLDRLPFTEADRALEEACDQIAATLGLTSGPASGGRPPRPPPPAAAKPEGIQQLEQQLEELRARKAQLEALGEDTRELREQINVIRRSLRMGRPLQRGDVLDDRFVVLDQLGSGGFATVWRALDQTTDLPVALKVLHAQHAHNAERRERFFRGARIMAQLAHPNIVKIIEPWASDGEYEY
ncbi:MAG TPA: protein kinase, partial [Nannocystis sp.]